MFKKKQSKFGPAAQELLDTVEGRRRPSPRQQALLDKQQAEFETSLTNEDRKFLKEFEVRDAFNKKYILRSSYEHDLRLARHEAIVNTSILFIFVVPTIAAILFWALKSLGWI